MDNLKSFTNLFTKLKFHKISLCPKISQIISHFLAEFQKINFKLLAPLEIALSVIFIYQSL